MRDTGARGPSRAPEASEDNAHPAATIKARTAGCCSSSTGALLYNRFPVTVSRFREDNTGVSDRSTSLTLYFSTPGTVLSDHQSGGSAAFEKPPAGTEREARKEAPQRAERGQPTRDPRGFSARQGHPRPRPRPEE